MIPSILTFLLLSMDCWWKDIHLLVFVFIIEKCVFVFCPMGNSEYPFLIFWII